MKKHGGGVEQAGRVSTQKIGRLRLPARHQPPRREAGWIERDRQLGDARFDPLDEIVDELKRRENSDGR